ncbi:hypothetical protein HPS36_07095 [Halorubrum salinarum]|uniref:Uncharacterized protein n=1 Tax=Halorubrum salinarum TaxID=2739057 RepID=A0A7D4D3J9_9EURY|nr:hypothetical protein [Halorubrum salinarum]QKG92622.1 hypothetical protein HPS36_07095 [Halorubrum salinarum]
MPDEPLPATERTDAEPIPTERGEPPKRDSADRSARAEPDRATDPPPDDPGGDAGPECDREAGGGSDESDDAERREYRLERLRLWRTVVTLAVVVARLIRSL